MEFRQQQPIYKCTINYEDKAKEIRLYRNEKVTQLEEYPGYHITSEGRVYSWYVNRFLHPDDNTGPNNEGGKSYIQYHLKNKMGQFKKVYAHILVWKAFGDGPILDGWMVHHINKDSTDNRIENLRLVTKEEHAALDGKILISIEPKAVDGTTFGRNGRDYPWTTMKNFIRVSDAAEYLKMTEKAFSKLINSPPEETFGDTQAWHAPDGRIVLKFEKHFCDKSALLYFEE